MDEHVNIWGNINIRAHISNYWSYSKNCPMTSERQPLKRRCSAVSDKDQLDEIYGRIVANSTVIIPETGERNQSIEFSLTDNWENSSRTTTNNAVIVTQTTRWQRIWQSIKNYCSKDVLKCAIAYLIASMAVYIEPIGRLLGTSDNKHLVATVAVYFHPSRTIGSMHQSIIFVLISLVYSFTVSIVCAAISQHTYNKGQDELSYLVSVVTISVALSIVSVYKIKMKKQTFNVACSLASTSMISSIIKEGSRRFAEDDSLPLIPIERLNSVFKIVVFGTAISVVLCYTLWPASAVSSIKKDLNTTFYLMSDHLSLLTDKFLMGETNHEKASNDVLNQLKKLIKGLKSRLEEVKYELLVVGKEKEYRTMEKIVDSTVLLSRYLAGLKNSSDVQWKLIHEGESENQPKFTATQIFNVFIHKLGPPLKSFSYTIREILDNIPFDNSAPYDLVANMETFETSLRKAQELFDDKQLKAMEKIYNSDQLFGGLNSPVADDESAADEFAADEEEVAASCFNFCYSITEYSNELHKVLGLFHQLESDIGNDSRSFRWLFFWRKSVDSSPPVIHENPMYQASDSPPSDNTVTANTEPCGRTELYIFKSQAQPTNMPLRYRIWKFFNTFRKSDIQFGVRVGIGSFLLSSVAFIPYTRQFFINWRLEWALIIYSIMMNQTIGGTQMTVKWRIIGTFLGSSAAVVTWKLTDGNPVALAIVGFLMSIPSFNIIIKWTSLNAYGRFILLSYNLTALYSYSMTLNDDEDDQEGGNDPIVQEIGFHRFVSVSIGIVWAVTITSFVLSSSARWKLKKGLSLLWLQLGIMWSSDPLASESNGSRKNGESETALGTVPNKEDNQETPIKFPVHELFAQLETYCSQAPMEFRIKGPFNYATYRSLLDSSEIIINALENMNMIILKNGKHDNFVVDYIKEEREELESRILLNFYMIASAMKLGLPLPTKGISTEHSKDRMLIKLAKIRKYQKNEKGYEGINAGFDLKDKDFAVVYSYILVSSQIVDELKTIIELIGELFEKVIPEELVL